MAPRDPQVVYSIENGFKNHNNSDEKHEVSFEDALNTVAFGKMHIVIIILSGLTLMSVLNETMGMAFIMPSSQCDLQLTSTDKGFLSAVAFLGIFLSSHLWGYLADTKGRRKIIIYTTLVSNVFTVISCFARDFWPFLILRFISGFFISGPSATIYAYLGEFTGQKYRATIISLACMFVGLSAVYLPVTAYFILGGDWSIYIYEGMYFRPWRLLLMTFTLPGLVASLCLLKIKESPKFLVAQGRTEESLNVLRWLHSKNTGKSEDSFPIQSIKSELDQDYQDNLKNSGSCSVIRSMWNQTVPLLKRPYILYFSVLCVLEACVFMVSGGIGMWYAEILNNLATSTNNVGSLCDVISAKPVKIAAVNLTLVPLCEDTIADRTFLDGTIIGALYILGFLLIGTTIKLVGRGVILAFCLFVSAASGFAIQVIEQSTLNVILFSSFLMFPGVAVSVINGTAVDLFPTHLRAMAVCVVLMCGRLGSIVGTNLVGQLLEYNCAFTFYLFSGIIFVTAYFILDGNWSIYIYEGMYFRPWRLLLSTYALPGLISALCLLKMKESPKFLVAQGRTEESLDVLRWLHSKNTGKSKDSFPIKSIKSELDQDYQENLKNSGTCSVIQSMWNQTVPLLKPPHILYFLILCLLQTCVFMVSAGLGMWYAEILNNLATSTNNVGSLCEVISSKTVTLTAVNLTIDNTVIYETVCVDTIADRTFLDGMIIGGLYILGYLLISSTIKPVGRGIILALCLFISAIAGLAIQFIQHSTLNVVLFSTFIMFSGVTISVINGTAVDLFPTHLRAMAVCIVLMCGRMGSVIGTNLVGQLLEYNCPITFYLFSGIIFGCGCLTFILPCLGLWYAEILNGLATSTDTNVIVCQAITPKTTYLNQTEIPYNMVCNDTIAVDTFFNGAILGFLYIIGYLLISFTIKPIGRRTILPLCLLISAISGVAIQFIENSIANVILFSMFLMFAGITVSIVTGTAVDLFPTHLRAMSVCLVLMCGRLGSIFGTNLVGQLLLVYCSATFYIFAGIIFVCACLTFILPS